MPKWSVGPVAEAGEGHADARDDEALLAAEAERLVEGRDDALGDARGMRLVGDPLAQPPSTSWKWQCRPGMGGS